MNIGAESLFNSRQGVDTASHNIANAQTEGYSRQTVKIGQRMPTDTRGVIIGNGAYVDTIKRSHDGFLEGQLNGAIQESKLSESKLGALKQLEPIFSPDMANSISDEMTNFFNAMQDMSAYPDEQPTRTNLRETALGLTNAFKRVDSAVKSTQSGLNEQIIGTTEQANALVNKIAGLNSSILSMEAGTHHEANDLRDQQELLIRQLSEKINIKTYVSSQGSVTVRGPGQSLLVDGKNAMQLTIQENADTKMTDVIVVSPGGKPQVITEHLEKGELGGLVDLRDGFINEIIEKNNKLAHSFANEVNKIHRQGFGIGSFSENTGRDFFTLPDNLEDAASKISLSRTVQESTDAISMAATPNAPGDNVIANDLLRLRLKPAMDNGLTTFNEYYANSIAKVGLVVEAAQNAAQADKVVLGDLEKRRDSMSGVSLDEEAVNLLRWQTAFAASSKVITTADEMLETLLTLKR